MLQLADIVHSWDKSEIFKEDKIYVVSLASSNEGREQQHGPQWASSGSEDGRARSVEIERTEVQEAATAL